VHLLEHDVQYRKPCMRKASIKSRQPQAEVNRPQSGDRIVVIPLCMACWIHYWISNMPRTVALLLL